MKRSRTKPATPIPAIEGVETSTKNAANPISKTTKKAASPKKSNTTSTDASPKKGRTTKKAASPKKGRTTKKAAFPKKSRTSMTITAKSNKAVSSTKSTNKSVSSKTKKSEEDDDENRTGGLKLLKRGMVTMSRITNRLIRGKRLTVKFNEKGEPVGKAAKEMQSYIGVLARTKIPISINDWREVDLDEKEKIWESIKDAFVVPKELKKMVISSAATKWREFKRKLTNVYIIPYMDEPELLENPPDDYRSITKDTWHQFVADRLSATFQEIREAQIAKRKENKYPHRMSRKGYANLMEELSESVPLEELDRATMWIKARQDRNGNFKQPEVEKKAEKIEHLRKREAEGEIATSGSDDVLTLALGNPEYRGRVRGVGGNVKPDLYFNLPKRQKMTFEQRTRLSLKKILEEEKEVLLAKERTAWEEERDRKIAEERAYWTERIAKLEAKVNGKELPVESPKPVTAVNELGSGEGSCSRHGEKAVEKAAEKAAHDNIEVEVKGVKKKLVLRDEVSIEVEEEIVQPSDERVRLNLILEEEVREDVIVLEAPVHGEEEQLSETKYKLAIDTVKNIVAIGTVISVDLETKQQTIHGVPLGEENLRVSITETVVPEALLPFPIKDEIVKVKDAIGTCVAWPRNLVIAPAPGGKKKPKRKIPNRPQKDMFDDKEDLQILPSNLPAPLKDLCIWANIGLRNGATIHATFGPELFGHPHKAFVFRKDIYAMTYLLEISGSCIVFYMSYLQGVLKKAKMNDMVAFVDPAHTGASGCGNPTERARLVSNRFINGKSGQIYLVPYNSGGHWTLSAVNPAEETIHFMDPLKRRLIAGEWKTILDNSIKFYNAHKNKKGRKTIQWKNLAGIPEQKDSKTCGYWIMRYMKEIVEDKNLEFAAKWERRTNLIYTEKDIDQVRAEWAKHVIMFPDM